MRPKLVEGKLYFIRAYDVGKGGVPLETSHDYIVKFIKPVENSKSGWKVVILATTSQPDMEDYYRYPGIPWWEYDGRESSLQISPYHRIFYMGEVRADDCMEVRKFEPKDAALCIGWPYVSDEILGRLQTA